MGHCLGHHLRTSRKEGDGDLQRVQTSFRASQKLPGSGKLSELLCPLAAPQICGYLPPGKGYPFLTLAQSMPALPVTGWGLCPPNPQHLSVREPFEEPSWLPPSLAAMGKVSTGCGVLSAPHPAALHDWMPAVP